MLNASFAMQKKLQTEKKKSEIFQSSNVPKTSKKDPPSPSIEYLRHCGPAPRSDVCTQWVNFYHFLPQSLRSRELHQRGCGWLEPACAGG